MTKEQIQNEADEIIEQMRIEGFTDAVNWGDIGCSSIYFDEEEKTFILICEEASPDAGEFQYELADRLTFKHPEFSFIVNTEW